MFSHTLRFAVQISSQYKVVFGLLLLAGLASMSSLAQPGAVDLEFDVGAGPDGAVERILLQEDGRILIAGMFTQVDGWKRPGIARLLPDGSVDPSFDPGSGTPLPSNSSGLITFLGVQTDGKIILSGFFTEYDGVPRRGLVRLHPDGSLDHSYAPVPGGARFLLARALQRDQVILSSFTRLNTDGTADESYAPRAELELPGWYTFAGVEEAVPLANGQLLARLNYFLLRGDLATIIIRVNPDGSLDPAFPQWQRIHQWFRPHFLMRELEDGRWLLVERGSIARMRADGTVDADFAFPADFLTGAILDLAEQTDGKLVLAGEFQSQDPSIRAFNITAGLPIAGKSTTIRSEYRGCWRSDHEAPQTIEPTRPTPHARRTRPAPLRPCCPQDRPHARNPCLPVEKRQGRGRETVEDMEMPGSACRLPLFAIHPAGIGLKLREKHTQFHLLKG